MRRQLALALAALALAAACAPARPSLKEAADRGAAPGATPRDLAAQRQLEPMRWQVGQWTLTRSVNEKGEATFARTAVAAQEAAGFWIETDLEEPRRRAVTRVLYAAMPRSAAETTALVRRIVIREDGKPEQVIDLAPNGAAAAAAGRDAGPYARGALASAPGPHVREDATVPAGTFRGCARVEAKAEASPFPADATIWYHPAVPLGGVVKSVSADGRWTLELVDFGTAGGASRP
jgi:hypothetical protein